MGPLRIQVLLFENIVRLILLYGSDILGVNMSDNMQIDRLFLLYTLCFRRQLHHKHAVVVGEYDQIPELCILSYQCLVLSKRLIGLSDT